MGDQNNSPEMELDETALQELYTWIDEIPLSRPKKNISRDFSDGGKTQISAGSRFAVLLLV